MQRLIDGRLEFDRHRLQPPQQATHQPPSRVPLAVEREARPDKEDNLTEPNPLNKILNRIKRRRGWWRS